MNIKSFIVFGVPVGKGRPKFSTVGGYAKAYTPSKTREYETLVRSTYQQAFPNSAPFEKDVALYVEIKAYFPIPKSTSKKKRADMEAGAIMHTKKPDCDNIAKAVLDALNGVAFHDDSQVVQLLVFKRYSDNPRVTVDIAEVCYDQGNK